jgi:hypothetical protein
MADLAQTGRSRHNLDLFRLPRFGETSATAERPDGTRDKLPPDSPLRAPIEIR